MTPDFFQCQIKELSTMCPTRSLLQRFNQDSLSQLLQDAHNITPYEPFTLMTIQCPVGVERVQELHLGIVRGHNALVNVPRELIRLVQRQIPPPARSEYVDWKLVVEDGRLERGPVI
ncbi:hypothetical protein RRG08_009536 [Elysia crispata]|uniref:Uncharacterized protein n=1 Tax=Elysia crispata TaxID=231223 RepID=A0AAE1B2K3_9GAST|nr:hypothetical protein RRG08_009536 [Elysia crispata]